MLSSEEYTRYSRHFNLPGFTPETQVQLQKAKVLVVGAGGLGGPVLLYLAAAGVGTLGIVDFDVVELSNLHRQVLFSTADIGHSKTERTQKVLKALNPNIRLKVYNEKLTAQNALDIISAYDVIADGTDNFPTRYLVNDACVLENKVNVYASIFRFEGQVSVFNYANEDGTRGPNYRDIYPLPPAPGSVPDCASGGVWGVLPGVIGCLQATEVLKILTGLGKPLNGVMLFYDALSASTRKMNFGKKTAVVISKLINYDQFCGLDNIKEQNMSSIKEITVQDLKSWKDSGKDFQLVDVREQHEWDLVNIEGDLIPLGEIMTSTERLEKEKDVVLLCRTGKRSAVAIDALQKQGFDNLYNLKGGIHAWAKEIDPKLPTY